MDQLIHKDCTLDDGGKKGVFSLGKSSMGWSSGILVFSKAFC